MNQMTEEQKHRKLLINNKELAANFVNEVLGIQWIAAVTKHIAGWVDKNGKASWEIVRFVSLQEGFVKNSTKRNVFSEMVFTFCRDVLPKDETAKKIKESMEKSKYKAELKDYAHLCDSNLTRGLVEEVQAFLKSVVIDDGKKVAPTIASRLEDYLRATVLEDTNNMPCSRIRINPDYGDDMTPCLSIEKYANKTFLASKEPSYIEAYECILAELEKDMLRVYIQKYAGKKNIKLYLVGKYGLKNEVYELAKMYNVGYVLINPRHEMNCDSYLLPRSVGDANSTLNYEGMLTGRNPLQVPLLVSDGFRVMSSLAEMLQVHDIPIKDTFMLKAPVLHFKTIEEKASELTRDYVEKIKERFDGELINVTPFDVFKEVERVGLKYEYSDLPAGQLGCMSLMEEKILLNKDEAENPKRLRFTMAHEYGHYVLHSDLLKSQGISSFGDDDDTITELVTVKENARWWLERQANHFAACLLMPKEIVCILYYYFHKVFVQDIYGDKPGPIYYNENQRETFYTYNNVVGNIAKFLNVSNQAMELRLKSLGLMRTN